MPTIIATKTSKKKPVLSSTDAATYVMDVHADVVGDQQLRYVIGQRNVKQYFVSDVVAVHGNAVLSHITITHTPRITNAATGNSQFRRLISETALKTALKAMQPTVRVVKSPRNLAFTGSNILVDAEVNSITKTRANLYKREIVQMCEAYGRKVVKDLGLTKEEVEASDREVYREGYRMLYSEFDRLLSAKLTAIGSSLRAYNLGRYVKADGRSYLERVETAGFLGEMKAVAAALFGK